MSFGHCLEIQYPNNEIESRKNSWEIFGGFDGGKKFQKTADFRLFLGLKDCQKKWRRRES
jgi:hypothetical protein